MCLAHPLKPFEIYNISHFYFDFEVKNVYKFIPIDLELPVLMFFPDLFILVYFIKFPMLASNMTACLSPTPGAELVIPVLQDPLVHPSVAPRAPFIPTLSTHHSPLLRPPKIPCPRPLRRGYLACRTEAAMIVMMMAW